MSEPTSGLQADTMLEVVVWMLRRVQVEVEVTHTTVRQEVPAEWRIYSSSNSWEPSSESPFCRRAICSS